MVLFALNNRLYNLTGISRIVEWKDSKAARQQTVTLLLNEGMGKPNMETLVIKEAEEFCNFFIEPSIEKNTALRNAIKPFTLAVSNLMFQLFIKRRFNFNDPELTLYTEHVLGQARANSIYELIIPYTKWIPGDIFGSAAAEKKNQAVFLETLGMFDKIVLDQRQQLLDGHSPNHMLGYMLMQSGTNYGSDDGSGKSLMIQLH